MSVEDIASQSSLMWKDNFWSSGSASGVARGQPEKLPPVGLDNDKIIVGSVVHAAELNWKYFFSFYEKRGVEYAENTFASRALPRIPPG